jgi:RNA polymerase sigma-70 factor, ECF subfamily
VAAPRLRLIDATVNVTVADAELVERALAGDGWAEEMIYRRHVGTVASAARRLLRDPSEAADVVQETFLIAFEKLPTLGEPAALRGWLARIAVSRVHRRWRWRRIKLWGAAAEEESLLDVAAPGLSPAERAELALIDERLGELPVKLRVPWVLRHVVGYSLDEVATACACSLASVKRYLERAESEIAAGLAEGSATGIEVRRG